VASPPPDPTVRVFTPEHDAQQEKEWNDDASKEVNGVWRRRHRQPEEQARLSPPPQNPLHTENCEQT